MGDNNDIVSELNDYAAKEHWPHYATDLLRKAATEIVRVEAQRDAFARALAVGPCDVARDTGYRCGWDTDGSPVSAVLCPSCSARAVLGGEETEPAPHVHDYGTTRYGGMRYCHCGEPEPSAPVGVVEPEEITREQGDVYSAIAVLAALHGPLMVVRAVLRGGFAEPAGLQREWDEARRDAAVPSTDNDAEDAPRVELLAREIVAQFADVAWDDVAPRVQQRARVQAVAFLAAIDAAPVSRVVSDTQVEAAARAGRASYNKSCVSEIEARLAESNAEFGAPAIEDLRWCLDRIAEARDLAWAAHDELQHFPAVRARAAAWLESVSTETERGDG